mgnify:CR=1 FL=1|tara:strand:+ start:2986 stop:3258 length:273 start_codon:yes stop_codon:yes gene_type:complete
MTRPIYIIAREIIADMVFQAINAKKPISWKRKYPYAAPYVEAMRELDSINDNYYLDSGSEIVNRFLCNAIQWRGDNAKLLKAELKAIAKG